MKLTGMMVIHSMQLLSEVVGYWWTYYSGPVLLLAQKVESIMQIEDGEEIQSSGCTTGADNSNLGGGSHFRDGKLMIRGSGWSIGIVKR